MTKKYKTTTRILGLLSFLLTMGPLLVYSIIGLFNAPPAKAVTLTITLITVLIFTLINLIFKHRIRCTTFVLLAGIYAALGHITSLIIIMAITTALDEFVVVPLYHKYKNLYTINNEIDKREEKICTLKNNSDNIHTT